VSVEFSKSDRLLGSADVLKAVEAKDLAAAKTAFGSMTKACGACHDKHKEKK
jgi:cytochrome c556